LLTLLLIFINVVAYVRVKSSMYVLLASMIIHTFYRICLVLGYPGPATDLANEWLEVMDTHMGGSSITLLHTLMGLFYGLGYGKLETSFTYTAMGHAVAVMRMMPPLVLSFVVGNARVLERALFIIMLPMLLTFWMARGIESLGYFLFLSLRQTRANEDELVELRSRCEQLETARRIELEEAHLRRLREDSGEWRPWWPSEPAAASGPVRRASRRSGPADEDAHEGEPAEGCVHGGTLFAAAARGDNLSSLEHLFD